VEVECENNVVVRGILCGRMKKRKIKVIQGDRVQVRVSPYDPSHGIITWRLR
jgi:translation initiation factor IF-1